MPLTVTCAKCGHPNSLGRLFCTQCGAKLDMEGPGAKPKSGGAGRLVGRLLRLVMTLGLLACLILVLRPVTPAGAAGTYQDAQRLTQKLRLLKGALLDRQPMMQQVREVEVNGYLAELLRRTYAQGGQEKQPLYRLSLINVALEPNRVQVLMTMTLGPVQITHEAYGRALKEDGRFRIHVEKVRLGHLPVPAVVGSWLAGRMSVVFSKLEEEKRLLDQLAWVELRDGEAMLATQSPP